MPDAVIQAAAAQPAGPVAHAALQDADRVPRVHSFSARHFQKTVLFHVTVLDGSLFLWIGDGALGLDDLQVAVPTPYDFLPSVAALRGDSDGPGSSLAQKLSKMFGRLVFLSYNLDGGESELLLFAQKELTAFLKATLGAPAPRGIAGAADAAAVPPAGAAPASRTAAGAAAADVKASIHTEVVAAAERTVGS